MGIHAATESEIAFDGVAITEDDVLVAGDPSSGEPFKLLLSHLNHERCGNAAMCVGAAQGALERAAGYMRERVVGGRPIADLQGLQWKLADMAVALEGARLLLGRAVRLAGPGGTPPALETAMAKTAANLAAKFVCDEAIQIHGGYGYSREYPLGAGLPGHPGAVHRRRYRRGPAQLHRLERGRRPDHVLAGLDPVGRTERRRRDPARPPGSPRRDALSGVGNPCDLRRPGPARTGTDRGERTGSAIEQKGDAVSPAGSYEGRRAIVCGGGGAGMGAAVVRQLEPLGAEIHVIDLKEPPIEVASYQPWT